LEFRIFNSLTIKNNTIHQHTAISLLFDDWDCISLSFFTAATAAATAIISLILLVNLNRCH